MSDIKSFNVAYDPGSDVLYISTRREPSSRGIEDRFGIVWRYVGDELIGATIVDFFDRWSDRPFDLAQELSRRFEIPAPQAQIVVEHALDDFGRKGVI